MNRALCFLILVAAMAGSAKADTVIHPVPAKPGEAALVSLINGCAFDLVEDRHTAYDGGESISYDDPMEGTAGSADWYIDGDSISLGGSISRLSGSDSECQRVDVPDWCWEEEEIVSNSLEKIRITPTGVMIARLMDPEGQATGWLVRLKCTNKLGLLLVPGSADRALCDALRVHIKKSALSASQGLEHYLVIEGAKAKKARQSSEIWFASGREADAKKVAEAFAPVLGDIEPKEWKWGGPHSLVVVVGKAKIGAAGSTGPALRVKVMDGHCPGAKGCSNPWLDAAAAAITGGGHAITAREAAKSKRAGLEVWFMAGKKAAAERLANETLLPALKKAKGWSHGGVKIEEWKWGGKFDLLVVVGSGGK